MLYPQIHKLVQWLIFQDCDLKSPGPIEKAASVFTIGYEACPIHCFSITDFVFGPEFPPVGLFSTWRELNLHSSSSVSFLTVP